MVHSQSSKVHITFCLLVICHCCVLGKQMQNWELISEMAAMSVFFVWCYSVVSQCQQCQLLLTRYTWTVTSVMFILLGCLSNFITCILSATTPSKCPLRAAWVSGSVMSGNCTPRDENCQVFPLDFQYLFHRSVILYISIICHLTLITIVVLFKAFIVIGWLVAGV